MSKIKSFKLPKIRWQVILILGLVILVGLGGFWWWQRSQPEVPNTTQVKRGEIRRILSVSGDITATQQARLRFVAGGKLTYVSAKTGDRVARGQVVATIDQATLQKQLEIDLNNYLKERWDFEELQDNYDYHVEELTTRRMLDKAQFDLENTVSSVEIRDIAIRNNQLRAPFAGILTQSPNFEAGSTLAATDFYHIVNPETLILEAQVDEADVGLLAEGLSAEIRLDAFPDQVLYSYVDSISYTSSESTSGTVFLVELPIDVYAGGLDQIRLGMNGDVEILLNQKSDVLLVPLNATRVRDNEWFVDVYQDGEKLEQAIEIGLEGETEVEVLSGLGEGQEVVLPE